MSSKLDEGLPLTDETAFYLSKDGETFGPHSVDEIGAFLDSGAVIRDDLLWTEGMEQWLPIGTLFRLNLEPPASEPPVVLSFKSPDVAETFLEPWKIVRTDTDGMSRRMPIAVVVAIVLHLGLLAMLTVGAATFFKLHNEVAVAPAPQEPPMDVTLVAEEDPPPPEETPPPPPPDDPPPPPALPDIPLPTVMQPPSPVPVRMPEPETPTPSPPSPLPVMTQPVPKAVKAHHVAATSLPVPQEAAPVTDASPSDYLDAPPPTYPYQARITRQEGTVILLVVINSAGVPASVTVAQSSGSAILDSVAKHQVAERFRFKVGNSRILRVPIDFHL